MTCTQRLETEAATEDFVFKMAAGDKGLGLRVNGSYKEAGVASHQETNQPAKSFKTSGISRRLPPPPYYRYSFWTIETKTRK